MTSRVPSTVIAVSSPPRMELHRVVVGAELDPAAVRAADGRAGWPYGGDDDVGGGFQQGT